MWVNSTTRKNLLEITLLANQGVHWLRAYKFCGYSLSQCVCDFLLQTNKEIPILYVCWPTINPAKFEPYVLPHGNSQVHEAFSPNLAESIEMIKKEGAHAGPKEVVSSVSHNVGGVMGAVAPGQLPRDEMQVSNAKRH